MAFFAWQNERDRQAQAEKARLGEIEARKNADIAIQKGQLEAQANQQNIQEVYKQKELFNALREAAIASGTPAEQADAVAHQQYAQYLASGPQAETGRNQLTTAITRGATPYASTRGATDEMSSIADNIAKISGSNVTTKRNEGALPFASTAGKANIQNEISGNTANQAENLNRYNIARERSTTAPLLASTADWEGIEKGKLGTTVNQTAQQYAPALTAAQSTAGISKAAEDTAQSNYTSTMFNKLDAGLAAQAHEAGMGSAVTEANLVNRTGGLVGGKVPYPVGLGEGYMDIPGVKNLISTALQGAISNPSPLPGTNSLPNRGGAAFRLPVKTTR